MSTLVQIKRSTGNTAPSSLIEGELAYSYSSNTLFIGDTANGVMNIGGKLYTNLIDGGSAANGSMTFVRRYSNGSAQFSQLDILVSPTSNNHVATKQYVDDAVLANVTLASLNDVNIGTAFSDQNNKILIGNSAGYYVGTSVTGNVSLSNTGIFTIGASQVVNSMLANAKIGVVAGAGLAGNVAAPALGETIQLDVIAGDGISNTGDAIAVNNTVVRTSGTQTINGAKTFEDTLVINDNLYVTGNIFLQGNTTYINVDTLSVTDSLIYLASNNIVSDIVDIGFIGAKNTGSGVTHTGLIRDASDGKYYLFDNLIDTGHTNNVVNVANTVYAMLRANIDAQSMNTISLGVSANAYVSGNTVISKKLIVGQDSEADVFVSNRTTEQSPNLSNFNGERLRLYDFDQVGRPNYAIGVESGHIWTGVDSSANSGGFKWYGNTSSAMRLSANGVLQVSNTVTAINIFATSLTLSNALPVGSGGTGRSSFTANGVFFANTSSSLSFATGTEGQVLQIASGVPAFAMLDGGSF